MSTKLNLLALSLSLYSHSVFAGSDWWWNTSLPKNTNSTLTIKAGTTGNATKNISINSTAANLTRYSSVGSQPYAIVQTNVGSLAKTRVIFTNTALAINWTVPTGITSIKLFLMGGGGGGCASYVNGVDTYGGGGGGAGEIVESNMTVTPGTVCSGFLGSGGSGGTGSVGMAGSIGGATQFVCGASTKRAYGGQGCNGLANMTMGSAYGGGGQPPGGITTAMPADGTYPINSTGQYYDSDIHGVVAAYAKYSPSTATHAIQVADSSLRNIPAGGGGGYYGSSPGNFKGESDGSNNDLAPGANSRIYGKGGMGYFGKGGDGGWGGGNFARIGGTTGAVGDVGALSSAIPAQGYGAGGNGGVVFASGKPRGVAGGGGGGYLGFPGVPALATQTIINNNALNGNQGIVVIEY